MSRNTCPSGASMFLILFSSLIKFRQFAHPSALRPDIMGRSVNTLHMKTICLPLLAEFTSKHGIRTEAYFLMNCEQVEKQKLFVGANIKSEQATLQQNAVHKFFFMEVV